MNSGELDRKDFGFSVAVGSLSQPLPVLRDGRGSKIVNDNGKNKINQGK